MATDIDPERVPYLPNEAIEKIAECWVAKYCIPKLIPEDGHDRDVFAEARNTHGYRLLDYAYTVSKAWQQGVESETFCRLAVAGHELNQFGQIVALRGRHVRQLTLTMDIMYTEIQVESDIRIRRECQFRFFSRIQSLIQHLRLLEHPRGAIRVSIFTHQRRIRRV